MLKNYLITALRNLKRNKVYTFLNVFGLALGIGCAMVIFKVIQFENDFDKHQANYDQIYRVVKEEFYPDGVEKGMGTPHPVGPTIKADFPEIQQVVRTYYIGGDQLNTYSPSGELNKFLIDEGICFTERSFFDIFSVEWIAGNESTALEEPNTVVISTSEARKLFNLDIGEESLALGKLINYNNIRDFKVVGIIADPVETTNLPFTYLFEYQGQSDGVNPYFYDGKNWNSTSSASNTYFIPDPSFDLDAFNEKLLAFLDKYKGEKTSEEEHLLAQPFNQIHFDEEYGSYQGGTSIQFLYALGIIGIFLLITACINFINLATAQAANRAKEIGIRKAIGGMSYQLIIQFLSEIGLITFFAMIMAMGISEFMFHFLKDLLGHQLSIDLLNSPKSLIFLGLLFVVVSLLSGFYPAVLLSRMNTIMALKKKIKATHTRGFSLRKGLVIVQFAISQFLIVGTLIVSSQMDFFLSKDLGFNTSAILSSYLPERDEVKMERFREKMLASPSIEKVSFSLSQPTGNSNSHSNFNYAPLESKKNYQANFKSVDEHFIDLFGIEVLEGRGIQKGDSNNVVINQRIADLMGFKGNYASAIGESIDTGWGGEKKIVGVIRDFHSNSLAEGLDYVVLINYPGAYYTISYKTPSLQSVEAANAQFEKVWEEVYPKYVSEYGFYDKEIAENYEDVQKITELMKIFAIISILIGCLGLYGLISFIAMNKVKEIGIRKVLGASVLNILSIFSKEVIILTTIAFVATVPLSVYFLNLWLDNFTFRIPIGAKFFVLSFITTLAIAMITTGYKSITAALINPANTLKDD